MKRVFKFKKETYWDGDEAIIHFLEEYLLKELSVKGGCPTIRRDFKVTVIVEDIHT